MTQDTEKKSLRITLAQTGIIWEDIKANIAAASGQIKAAAAGGSELILFPEMSFTGFSMNTALTSDREGQTLKKMSEIASENNISIGFGWVRPAGEKCENVYTVIDNNGNKALEQVKIHPFSYSGEDRFFTGSDQIYTGTLSGIPFAAFICYDLRFPEVFRAVCTDAHFIIVPACWPASRSSHWKALLRARAIENILYIIGINACGDIGGQYYSGDSCIINPTGEIIQIISDKPGLITFDLTDDTPEYRSSFPALTDIKRI